MVGASQKRTRDQKGKRKPGGTEKPVAESEEPALGVEGDVGPGALGIVVGGAELGAGRLEATAGDEGGGCALDGAEGSGGKHLRSGGEDQLVLSIERFEGKLKAFDQLRTL